MDTTINSGFLRSCQLCQLPICVFATFILFVDYVVIF